MKHDIIVDETMISLADEGDYIELRITGLKGGFSKTIAKHDFVKFVRLVNGFDHALNREGHTMETVTVDPITMETSSVRRK